MPAPASQNAPVIWVLVADSKTARIYQCDKVSKIVPLNGSRKHSAYEEKTERELVPVPDAVIEADTLDNYQIGHSRRGTTSSSASPAHNTYEPHGDIKEELKRRFTETIAVKLKQALAGKNFDRLILVAPAKMIGELRKQLAPEVQHRIVAAVPKDLANYQGHDLMEHLRETLMEAHVA